MAVLRGAARAPPDETLAKVPLLEVEAIAEDEVNSRQYRAYHVLVDLGWVDFDICVPPTCPAA